MHGGEADAPKFSPAPSGEAFHGRREDAARTRGKARGGVSARD